MPRPLKIVFSWLFLFSAVLLPAQKLRFKHITGEDGLSTGFVKTIIQDDRGFMWFGTQDGLNRYDGYQIRVYRRNSSDQASLSSSDITCLMQVRPDLFLVGTRSGLNYFNPVTETFRPAELPGKAGRARINALLDLDTGAVLVGTSEGLVMLRLRSGRSTFLDFDQETALEIRSLGRAMGSVFAGASGKGLWRLGTAGKMQHVELADPDMVGLVPADIATITCIREYGNKLYLGTASAGIFKFDQSLELMSRISFSGFHANTDAIRDFLIRNNTVYAATAYGTAVHQLISGRTAFYTRQENAESLNSNPCNCIFADAQNNFWIGTDLGGVNVSMHRSLRFPLSPFGFETAYDNIYCFAEGGENELFAGGVQTLVQIDLAAGKTRDLSSVLGNGSARCLYLENARTLWIGTWGNGIIRYDLQSGKAESLKESPAGTILAFYYHNGSLYAASAGDGLFRIDTRTGSVTRYGAESGLPGLSINSIFFDSGDNLWLGTYDAGLVKAQVSADGVLKVARVYNNSGRGGDIASNVVFGVGQATNGAIWAATSSGLSKLLPDHSFRNFGQNEGLANTYLYTLVRDSSGQFWAGSNAGLIRFDPALAHESITFKSYGLKDGLVNTAYHPGAALSFTNGLMCVGGPKGFNVFRPGAVRDNLHQPPVFIVGYKSGGHDVKTDTLITYKRYLELEWSRNSFQFELAALDFTDPSKNLFSYMLEGYDRDWSAPVNVRYVSYNALPGGSYTFRVKAANNDGIFNETPLELHIRVVPPFWRTTFFYILISLAGLTLIYGYTLLRTRTIRRENTILERKVAQRTRELEARNRDITSSIEYARRIQEAILPSRDHIFQKLKKVFILYKPKDIVSGDFYWFAEKNGIKIFAVVDCTGHGVPGAFMSMIGHNLLDQVVSEQGITDPGDILNHLHQGVMHALRQGHNELSTNDGMDVSIIAINDASREVRWAGANRPLIMIDAEGRFTRYDGNKDPVGGVQAHLDRTFTTHVIRVELATMAYLFSDGYADQFGGENGKKFMVKRFHQLLVSIHRQSPDEQQAALEQHFEAWRQNHEQVDDVLIVGIEV